MLRVALTLALGVATACGAKERAPNIVDYTPDAGTSASFGPEFEEDPMAALCGQTTVGLEFIRNNLYFVVDASGSMQEEIPGSSELTRYEASTNAIEQVLQSVGHRVNYGAMVFPGLDESGCGAGREILTMQRGDRQSHALSGSNGPVLGNLVRRLEGVNPGGGTSTGATLHKVAEELEFEEGRSFVFLITDGAPNCNPELECESDTCIANIEGWTYGGGMVCDESINCCVGSPASCLDADETQRQVEELRESGIQTFVIGIPGTATYADFLDELAIAGGTARERSPFYYSITSSDELSDVLQSLGRNVSIDCTIELNEPAPDPTLVNVLFDGTPVAFDEQDGWRWLDDSTLELVGDPCELLTGGQVSLVDIVAGCPVFLR